MSANDELLRQRHEDQATTNYWTLCDIRNYVETRVAEIQSLNLKPEHELELAILKKIQELLK
jgi:hypothetical protein